MENRLNIAEIREYNRELKEYTRKFSDTRAKMDLNTNEVNRLCKELTEELGMEVNPQNLEQVYAECVEKINNQLAVGKEILNRIKYEEQNTAQTTQAHTQPTPTHIQPTPTPMTEIPQMFGFTQPTQPMGFTTPIASPFEADNI